MKALRCGAQNYEWGVRGAASMVAQLAHGASADPSKPYAELWIGAHPSNPSSLLPPPAAAGSDASSATPPGISLRDYVVQHSAACMGPNVPMSPEVVPFLLKVLSIGKALSIQAHPDKGRAAKLHAADPKNYPDPNHKPELIVALTEMDALCCFRPVRAILENVARIAPLRDLLGDAAVADFAALVNATTAAASAENPFVRNLLAALYAAPADRVAASLTKHIAALQAETSDRPGTDLADSVFLRVATQEFPGDVGCWMVYILNVVKLLPGDGLFLSQNEPHAYLRGNGVEVMASSDNVVRAGLTPKFKDVPTLLEMLTYRTEDGLAQASRPGNHLSVQCYAAPAWCQEFSLMRVELVGGVSGGHRREVTLPTPPSLVLAIVTNGSGTVLGQPVSKGATFMVPHSAVSDGLHIAAKEGAGTDTFSVFLASTAGWQEPAGNQPLPRL